MILREASAEIGESSQFWKEKPARKKEKTINQQEEGERKRQLKLHFGFVLSSISNLHFYIF